MNEHAEVTRESGATGDRIRDRARLRALGALDLDAVRADDILADIVEEASSTLNIPISLVSLVLDEAQIFPVSRGLQGWLARVQGTPIEWSFCVNAVESDTSFVVEDALENPAVQNNPLVELDGIRCYAGIPLRARDGSILGTLCVLGTEARQFSEADLEALRVLASRATRRLWLLSDDRS